MESLYKFTDVCNCSAYASIPRTVHYLYPGVRHYGEGTRGHKLARVSLRKRPFANNIHTTQSKLLPCDRAPRLRARCLTPNVTHLNYDVYSRILQRESCSVLLRRILFFLIACYIERRKFSRHPPIINSSTNFRLLFIDTSGYLLYSGCSRALPFGLTIYRLVPLPLPRIHARRIKGRKSDRYTNIYDLVQRESVLLRRIFKRFLFIYFYDVYDISQSSKLNSIFKNSII